jgi:hypothetical protein
MKAALALAVVLLLGVGCDRNRPATCVSGASSPCTCATGLAGAQLCQSDGTFGACMCAPPPAPTPVVVVTPDVPMVAPAPVAAPMVAPTAPMAAAPHAPHAPTAAHAPAAANPMPTLTIPNLLPTAPTQGNTTATPSGNTAPSVDQLGQLGQLLSRGLNAQQIQSITQAITSANRSQAPNHPTFSPTELTRLSEMATQGGAGPGALQSAAQSMLGGN